MSYLRLVVWGDIIGLRNRLGNNRTIVLIGVPGADEGTHAVPRFGI